MTASRLPQSALMAVFAVLLALPAVLLARPEGAMSDSIAERVIAAWGTQPSGIIVKVNDGVVEMWGEAPSAAAVNEAEQIARSTVGVHEVVNHLRTSREDMTQSAAAR